MIDFLIYLIVICIVAGLIFYCLQLLPIAQPFKNVVLVLAIIVFILVLLNMIGVFGGPGFLPLRR